MNPTNDRDHGVDSPVEQTKARILVVDDHELLRVALKGLLSSEPDLDVCGEASSEDEAFEQVGALAPDLLVVDLALKGGNGLDLVKRVKARHPEIRVLVFSMYDSRIFAERALRAGASGYVNKQQPSDDLVAAVRAILAGDIYVNETMTREMLRRAARPGEPAPHSPIEDLSDRELEIFRLIGQGKATRQIAAELHISTSTVETYRERLKTKLGLKNGAELTRRAIQWMLENG